MDKILVKFIVLLLLLSSSICEDVIAAEKETLEKAFYLKGGVGLNTIIPFRIENSEYKGKVKTSNKFPLVEAGIGYRFTDSIRGELIFDYYFLFHSNETSTNTDGDVYKIAYKTKINTLMLNGYKDIITIGKFTPFIGGGIGINSLKDKSSGNIFHKATQSEFKLDSSNSRLVHKFVYKLTLGIDIKLYDEVNLELSYNYFNLGSNRPRIVNGMATIVKRPYYSHSLIAGIRMEL
jgi:opacity protein-like surface antigen